MRPILRVLQIGIRAKVIENQAPHTSEYVPDPIELEDHVPVYIPEPEHSEDLVPVEDEAPIEAYITEVASAPPPPPSFLPPLIRPPCTRVAMAQMRVAAPSAYHPLLLSGTLLLLPIPLPTPSTSCRADIPEADMPPQKRLLLTAPTLRHCGYQGLRYREEDYSCRRGGQPVGQLPGICSQERESLEFYSQHQEAQEDRAAMRSEIKILRRERLAYEQESIETRQALARSEAYSRALEARIRMLETQAYRHEWQRQDAYDRAIEHIMRTQALEAGARVDTLEETGSSA
ncbi:hypothetical protein Tco_1278385 [Tanacetum coccineum]